MAIFRASLLLATTLVLIAAEENTYLECDCSPSARGFHSNVLTELRLSRAAIQEYSKAEQGKLATDKSLKASDVQKRISEFAITLWEACIANYDPEQCVNADVSLRLDSTSSFCKFQEGTWANIIDGKIAHRCDLSDMLASEDRVIVSGKAEVKTARRPSESPVSAPSKKVATGGQTQSGNTESTETNTIMEGETPLPTTTPTPFPPAAPKNNTSGTDKNATEGCVALEHLQGYAMQHRTHLERVVLCSAGFCATPNHAIIVNGRWTSMKLLCAGTWECVRSVKLVNNLNVFKNRRAVVGDVVITPYDLRFPRAGVFLVQALERLMYLVLDHSITFVFSVVAGLLVYKASW